MNEPKFTKGPWYLKATQHANGVLCHYVCHGDDEIVCTTETDDMPDSHLIAAAPEMYQLLAEISDCAGTLLLNDDGVYLGDEIGRLLARARGEA